MPGYASCRCACVRRGARVCNVGGRKQVCGDISLAIQYLKAMVAAGFEPSVAAINALLGACTRSSDALDIVKTVQVCMSELCVCLHVL